MCSNELDLASIKTTEERVMCMFDKVYESVADLDKALFDEFSAEIPEDLEDVPEEPVVAEQVEDEEEVDEVDEEEVDSEEDAEEPEDPEPKTTKVTKEDRKDYAFGKMRKENAEYKRMIAEKEQALSEREAVLKRLMGEAGYDDFGEFKSVVEKQLAQKEREEKGYTEEQYAEIQALKQRNAELENRTQQYSRQETASKAQAFDSVVRGFAQQYDLGEKGVRTIYTELEKAGYDVGMLISQPKPEVLIKGIMADMIQQKAVTEHISKKATRKTLDNEKLPSTQAIDDDASSKIDQLVQRDLAEYRKRFRG